MEEVIQMLYDCTIISEDQAIKYCPSVTLYHTHTKKSYVSDSELDRIFNKVGAARDAAIRSLLDHFYKDIYNIG